MTTTGTIQFDFPESVHIELSDDGHTLTLRGISAASCFAAGLEFQSLARDLQIQDGMTRISR